MQRPTARGETRKSGYGDSDRFDSQSRRASYGNDGDRGEQDDSREDLRRGKFDLTFVGIALLLVVLGLLFVLSSSSYTAGIKGDSFSDFRSQLTWAIVGFGAMVTMTVIDYRILKHPKLVLALICGTLLLLVLLLILPTNAGFLRAPKINGARRWLRIMAGETILLSLQPSEIAKFAVILFLAVRLSVRQKDVKSFLKTVVPCMLVAGVFFLLIMGQPNLSTAGTLIIVTIIMLFIAGASIPQIGGIILAMIPVAIYYANSKEYRKDRLLSFVDPWAVQGDEGYQLVQSLYALANGGLFGTGFGMSRQKYSFLPYASSDFIFAIVAEEVGLIGSLAILALFALLVYRGLHIAIHCPDRFGSLLAAGLTVLLAVQVVINIAVVTGSMPTTGLPLPFFTLGGTSLAIFMAEIGILLSISRLKSATDPR